MNWILDWLRPPENCTPKQMSRWCFNVCISLLWFWICCGIAISPYGFARAGDLDSKIKSAVSPIAQAQSEQGRKLDEVSRLLTEQLAATVAAQIRLTISKRCKTAGFVEREELNREKDRLQDQYLQYKGMRYSEPACGDL